jgi:hypothetical protein
MLRMLRMLRGKFTTFSLHCRRTVYRLKCRAQLGSGGDRGGKCSWNGKLVVAGRLVDAVPRLVCDDGTLTVRCSVGCRSPSGGPKCWRLLITALTAIFIQELLAMLRWFYVLAHLLVEAGAARRDARIRFLRAQVEILRRKLAVR